MSEIRRSVTDLRRGRVQRLRRPKGGMEPITPQELDCLDADPEERENIRPVTLHDSNADPLLD